MVFSAQIVAQAAWLVLSRTHDAFKSYTLE